MIPIAKPLIGIEEIESVRKVMESGIVAQGPMVEEFESKFSDYLGVEHSIATNSGTAALHVSLLAHGIGEGDEVITTPFSFIATGNSIKYVGAKPVFADIGEDFNIDIDEIQKCITPNTKAIIPVHLFGLPCDMKGLMDIAEDHDLILIEDCAQSHGSEYGGKKTGSFGTGCFSFYPTKNMTSSEGGIITTNDEVFAEKARMIRNHGMRRRYYHETLGFNLRMTDIEAAIAIEQLKKLDGFNEKRIYNANFFDRQLGKIKAIQTPARYAERKHVYHQYSIRVDERDDLANYLNENGIGTGVYYPVLINEQYGFQKEGPFPIADRCKDTILSLPVHPSVNEEDLNYIVGKLRDYYA